MENQAHEKKLATLIAEIAAAFDGVKREDGITLHEAQALDDYEGPEGQAKARAMDTETRWQDVPVEDITQGYNVLSFLDPKGFRYYIPAYLIWYLTVEVDCNTYNSIEYFLDKDYEAAGNSHYLPHVSLLTPEQSKAIAHFCVFAAEQEERANAEFERTLDERVASRKMTQEERDSGRQRAREFMNKAGMPDNYFQRALQRYWGKFL